MVGGPAGTWSSVSRPQGIAQQRRGRLLGSARLQVRPGFGHPGCFGHAGVPLAIQDPRRLLCVRAEEEAVLALCLKLCLESTACLELVHDN